MIDPLNDEDMYSVIAQLLESNNYHNYCRIIETIELTRSWDDVADEHLRLFEEMLHSPSRKYWSTNYKKTQNTERKVQTKHNLQNTKHKRI